MHEVRYLSTEAEVMPKIQRLSKQFFMQNVLVT